MPTRRPLGAAVASAAIALIAAAPLHALTQAEIDRVAPHATRGAVRVVRSLASNALRGRDNDTPESLAAQRYLIGALKERGPGLNRAASGNDAYRQPFDESGQRGTNLLAVIPGRELPNEYVIVDAHYDHLDSRSDASGHCSSNGPPGGAVCNGATDNAAGVAAVPTIFFSDSTGGCYHTTGDDVRIVDFRKLAQQTAIAFRTVVALSEAPSRPAFIPPNPAFAVFEDAVSLQRVLATAVPADLGLFGADQQALITTTKAQLDQIVSDGPAQFDGGDVTTVLNAAVALIDALTGMGCRAF